MMNKSKISLVVLVGLCLGSDVVGMKTPRRVRWTVEDDAALRRACATAEIQFKTSDALWTTISSLVPGKTAKECRSRVEHFYGNGTRNDPFTPEEDAVIVGAVERIGLRWRVITMYLSDRSASSIRDHYWAELSPNKRLPLRDNRPLVAEKAGVRPLAAAAFAVEDEPANWLPPVTRSGSGTPQLEFGAFGLRLFGLDFWKTYEMFKLQTP